MKRLIAIVLAMVLLTACGTQSVAEGYETARPSNEFMNLNRNGEFFVSHVHTAVHTADGATALDGDILNFFDFSSMTSAIICPKPNCRHYNPETCSAFGMENHPTIIGDKLYFFAEGTGWIGDTVVTTTRIYRAETDGTGRAEICYLENLSVTQYENMLIKGNTAYFIGTENEFDNVKFTYTGFDKSHMCSFNFETREFKDYGIVIEGYNSGVTLIGEYDSGIFISCSYTEEKIDFFADDAMEQLMALSISEEYRFDLDSGEIAKNELPAPTFVGGGFYGYQSGDNAVILDSAGNEKVYENYELSDSLTAIPINGIVFNMLEMTAIDLENGKVLSLNKDVVDTYDIILTYADGEYVVRNELGENYKKISDDDLFKK